MTDLRFSNHIYAQLMLIIIVDALYVSKLVFIYIPTHRWPSCASPANIGNPNPHAASSTDFHASSLTTKQNYAVTNIRSKSQNSRPDNLHTAFLAATEDRGNTGNE